jgi:hypothetical protein
MDATMHCRTGASIFDVSHMCGISLKVGLHAADWDWMGCRGLLRACMRASPPCTHTLCITGPTQPLTPSPLPPLCPCAPITGQGHDRVHREARGWRHSGPQGRVAIKPNICSLYRVVLNISCSNRQGEGVGWRVGSTPRCGSRARGTYFVLTCAWCDALPEGRNRLAERVHERDRRHHRRHGYHQGGCLQRGRLCVCLRVCVCVVSTDRVSVSVRECVSQFTGARTHANPRARTHTGQQPPPVQPPPEQPPTTTTTKKHRSTTSTCTSSSTPAAARRT